MSWDRTPEGWLAKVPTAAVIDAAKAERARRDANHRDLFKVEPDRDWRWAGELAELGFKDWLRSVGLEFRHNGGVDDLPDFEVCGISVGLKCRTATTRFRPSYVVNVPAEHMRRREQAFFFCCYEKDANRMLLLGGISHSRFREVSYLTDVPHRAAGRFHKAWNVPAFKLTPPATMASLLRVRAAA